MLAHLRFLFFFEVRFPRVVGNQAFLGVTPKTPWARFARAFVCMRTFVVRSAWRVREPSFGRNWFGRGICNSKCSSLRIALVATALPILRWHFMLQQLSRWRVDCNRCMWGPLLAHKKAPCGKSKGGVYTHVGLSKRPGRWRGSGVFPPRC